MDSLTPVDYLTVDSPTDQVKAAIQQTEEALAKQGVPNPEAVAISRARRATGRFIPLPPEKPVTDPIGQQFGQLILQTQAEDAAKQKEAARGSGS